MALAFADIAFTPLVRAEQDRKGSAATYGKFLSPDRLGGDALGPQEAAFLSARDGFYQATVSETGWPYVQFRGGEPGFLTVLDDKTVAYADYRGNRQYISAGNLTHSARVSIIAMDYPNQRRLKLWGQVDLIDPADDPALTARLNPGALPIERIAKITVSAIDWNCPRHIPRRFTLGELEPDLLQLHQEISRLRAENAALKGAD